MEDEAQCVFQFEAEPDQPCWGDFELWDLTDEGDLIYACEGHSGWSLIQSYEWNRAHYTRKDDNK
jgi:hypothetical protein